MKDILEILNIEVYESKLDIDSELLYSGEIVSRWYLGYWIRKLGIKEG